MSSVVSPGGAVATRAAGKLLLEQWSLVTMSLSTTMTMTTMTSTLSSCTSYYAASQKITRLW